MAVDLEKKGHVGVITMNRPEALNALNTPMIHELENVIARAEADEDIYVCIITGAGRSFVAGADIGEMSAFGAVEGKAFGDYGNSVFLKIENMLCDGKSESVTATGFFKAVRARLDELL